MRNLIKAALLLALLCATVSGAARAQVSVGISIGAPPPPRVVVVRPARPEPVDVWVDGYWYPVAGRYSWHAGYWTEPPYAGAIWVAPRHEGGRFYEGYWNGDHGRVEHDHRWDHDRDRDYHYHQDNGRHLGQEKHADHDHGNHGHDDHGHGHDK
jgi:hypothetical protein